MWAVATTSPCALRSARLFHTSALVLAKRGGGGRKSKKGANSAAPPREERANPMATTQQYMAFLKKQAVLTQQSSSTQERNGEARADDANTSTLVSLLKRMQRNTPKFLSFLAFSFLLSGALARCVFNKFNFNSIRPQCIVTRTIRRN